MDFSKFGRMGGMDEALQHRPAMANGDSEITLKLLIDARSQKVLFAEAGNDFIDFMFSLLILPLGSIIKLLSPGSMVGSIGKLYQSVENLKETYLIPNRDKATLLQPTIPSYAGLSPLLLSGADSMNQITYYSCQYCHKRVTSAKNINCPTCKKVMSGELEFVVPSSSSSAGAASEWQSEGGFVKGVITYMITDDLEITPMSAISSITLINRFSMKKDVVLEEKVVTVGRHEGAVRVDSAACWRALSCLRLHWSPELLLLMSFCPSPARRQSTKIREEVLECISTEHCNSNMLLFVACVLLVIV